MIYIQSHLNILSKKLDLLIGPLTNLLVKPLFKILKAVSKDFSINFLEFSLFLKSISIIFNFLLLIFFISKSKIFNKLRFFYNQIFSFEISINLVRLLVITGLLKLDFFKDLKNFKKNTFWFTADN